MSTQEGTSKLERTEQALATAARVRQQIINVMISEGLQPSITTLEANAASEAQDIAKQINLGNFNADVITQLDAIVSGQLDDITSTFRDASREIAAAMRQGITTGASLSVLIDDIASIIDTTFLRAQAAVDSAIMAAGRTVTINSGEAAAEATGEKYVYVYTGPDDAKIREFCSKHIGKAYTIDALDKLDNGDNQPKPVSVFLGGYNCRHTLSPIPLPDAQAEGLTIITR